MEQESSSNINRIGAVQLYERIMTDENFNIKFPNRWSEYPRAAVSRVGRDVLIVTLVTGRDLENTYVIIRTDIDNLIRVWNVRTDKIRGASAAWKRLEMIGKQEVQDNKTPYASPEDAYKWLQETESKLRQALSL